MSLKKDRKRVCLQNTTLKSAFDRRFRWLNIFSHTQTCKDRKLYNWQLGLCFSVARDELTGFRESRKKANLSAFLPAGRHSSWCWHYVINCHLWTSTEIFIQWLNAGDHWSCFSSISKIWKLGSIVTRVLRYSSRSNL